MIHALTDDEPTRAAMAKGLQTISDALEEWCETYRALACPADTAYFGTVREQILALVLDLARGTIPRQNPTCKNWCREVEQFVADMLPSLPAPNASAPIEATAPQLTPEQSAHALTTAVFYGRRWHMALLPAKQKRQAQKRRERKATA